jgi:putative FmdB family regulatory protein
MPIFEYICRECSKAFEAIVYGTQQAECPGCGSAELEKQLSVFAVGARGASSKSPPAAGACGACGDPRGPGSCAME